MFYAKINDTSDAPYVEYVPNNQAVVGRFLDGDSDRPRVTRVMTDGDSDQTTPSAALHRGPRYYAQPSMHVELFYRRM